MKKSILRPTLTILLLILINVYFQFKTGISDPKFGDSQHYLLSAQAIYNQQEYPRVFKDWPFFRSPGYPFLISILWKITFYNSIIVIKLFNSMCIGLIGLGIYLLARRNISENFSIAALILATLNPFVFLQSLEVSTETITTVLFIFFIILLTHTEFKSKGLLLGITSVSLFAIRPEFLFVCVTTIILYYLYLNFDPKKLIIPILLVVLSLNYWGSENKKATGSYMPLTNATSFMLWLGSTETIYENYPLKFQNTAKFRDVQYDRFAGDMKKVMSKYAFKESVTDLPRQSASWFSEYVKNVNEDKISYIKNFFMKCSVFWRPFLNPSSYGPKSVLGSFLILFPFMIFSIIGCLFGLRRRVFRSEIIVVTQSLIVLTLVHALQMPDFRYRVPILPTMSVMTVYFLSIAYKLILTKRGPSEMPT